MEDKRTYRGSIRGGEDAPARVGQRWKGKKEEQNGIHVEVPVSRVNEIREIFFAVNAISCRNRSAKSTPLRKSPDSRQDNEQNRSAQLVKKLHKSKYYILQRLIT